MTQTQQVQGAPAPAPATAPASNPLDQLKDIQLPEAVSAWPPAPGWPILFIVLSLLLGWLVIRMVRNRRYNEYRTAAKKELLAAFSRYKKDNDSLAYLKVCNALLRRTALHHYPDLRGTIAPLVGKQWFEFLDGCCSANVFLGKMEESLYNAHYRKDDASLSDTETKSLHKSALHWIERHK